MKTPGFLSNTVLISFESEQVIVAALGYKSNPSHAGPAKYFFS